MRTTVEIPDRLRAGLMAVAAKRGLRGYSRILQEALELYLESLAKEDVEMAALLRLKGKWSDHDVAKLRMAIREVRDNWGVRPPDGE